jgi:hypothetical protein
LERVKQKLEEARKQRERLLHRHTTSIGGVIQQDRRFTFRHTGILLLSGMAVAVLASMITWWIISGHAQTGARLSGLDLIGPQQSSSTGNPAIDRLEARIDGLNERVEILSVSIARLETTLTRAQAHTNSITGAEQQHVSAATPGPPVPDTSTAAIESLPHPAAGQAAREAGAADASRHTPGEITNAGQETAGIAAATSTAPQPRQEHNRTPPMEPASHKPDAGNLTDEQSVSRERPGRAAIKTALIEQQDPATRKQAAVSVDMDGPWVINLVSSPSKADADHLSDRAWSRGIQTEQQQVTVKGKQYWRVQITGFPTAEAARTYADTAREKLDLKDVWIMTK